MIELSLHSGEGTRSECRLQRGLQIEECYRYKLFSKLFVQSKHAVVRTTPITASDCFSWKGMQFFPVKSYTNVPYSSFISHHSWACFQLIRRHTWSHDFDNLYIWGFVFFVSFQFHCYSLCCRCCAKLIMQCICLGPWGWALKDVIPKTS